MIARRLSPATPSTRTLALVLSAAVLACAGSVVAQDVGSYREFSFGTSLVAVATATGSGVGDAVVIHARPRLIQELVWRPRYQRGGALASDPVRDIQFRFVDDQLFSVIVGYDAHKIEGLTAPDLIDAVSTVYGPPTSRRPPGIATWDLPAMRVTLTEAPYPSPYQLVVVSTALESAARAAAMEAERQDRVEAPKRDAAEQAARAEQHRLNQTAARTKNKASFRP